MAKLFDSVAPDVKIISLGSAPIKSATCMPRKIWIQVTSAALTRIL